MAEIVSNPSAWTLGILNSTPAHVEMAKKSKTKKNTDRNQDPNQKLIAENRKEAQLS